MRVATEVEAHITGTVFKIETSVGAQVSEGDVLVILESMKMEMPIEAPRAGTVSEVRVEAIAVDAHPRPTQSGSDEVGGRSGVPKYFELEPEPGVGPGGG